MLCQLEGMELVTALRVQACKLIDSPTMYKATQRYQKQAKIGVWRNLLWLGNET